MASGWSTGTDVVEAGTRTEIGTGTGTGAGTETGIDTGTGTGTDENNTSKQTRPMVSQR